MTRPLFSSASAAAKPAVSCSPVAWIAAVVMFGDQFPAALRQTTAPSLSLFAVITIRAMKFTFGVNI